MFLKGRVQEPGYAKVIMFSMNGDKILDINNIEIADIMEIKFEPVNMFNGTSKIELNDIILNSINQKISAMLTTSKTYSTYLKKVQEKKIDPFEASDKISKNLLRE